MGLRNKMNKIISFGILIGTALCTTPSYAQSTAEGRIVNIGVNFAGTARIRFESVNNPVSCGEAYPGYSVNVNTEGGQAIYSLALSAEAQGKIVRAGGQGKCDIRADTENIQWLVLPPQN